MLLSQKIEKLYNKMLNGEKIYMRELIPLMEEAKKMEKDLNLKEKGNPVDFLPYL